jgi:two-component system LytT family response regulator
MIRSVLVDDELNSCEILSWQLKEFCPDIQIVNVCTDPFKALDAIRNKKPDLVFLDIQMPHMNGFELLKKLMPISFDVIFVTAYDQFAVKAFEFSALDYLMKPIEREDLVKAVSRVRVNHPSDERLQLLLDQLESLKRNEKIKRLAISTADSYHFVNIDEIVCCESERNYTKIHLVDGKNIMISKTMKTIEGILDLPHFFRTHQSYLVNLNHVKKFNRDSGGYVVMSNGMTITVSKNKKDELFERFAKI